MTKYWVLKTREDREDPETGRTIMIEQWPNFRSEGVIAIGWKLSPELRHGKTNLEDINSDELVEDLMWTSYAGDRPRAIHAAPKILKFIKEMSLGDKILLCQGYAPKQEKDVHIYGLARVRSTAWYDNKSSWWKVKRKADICSLESEIPKARLQQILQRRALREIVYQISESSFQQVCEWLSISFNC